MDGDRICAIDSFCHGFDDVVAPEVSVINSDDAEFSSFGGLQDLEVICLSEPSVQNNL